MSLKRATLMGPVLAVLAAVCALSGCGASTTTVLKAPSERGAYTRLALRAGNPTTEVPAKISERIAANLAEDLYRPELFAAPEPGGGADLTLTYRIVQMDKGDQFARWFWGGIGNAGEGTLTIEGVYSTPLEPEVARVNTQGRIGSGVFGGSFESAVDKATEALAKYTEKAFRAEPAAK